MKVWGLNDQKTKLTIVFIALLCLYMTIVIIFWFSEKNRNMQVQTLIKWTTLTQDNLAWISQNKLSQEHCAFKTLGCFQKASINHSIYKLSWSFWGNLHLSCPKPKIIIIIIIIIIISTINLHLWLTVVAVIGFIACLCVALVVRLKKKKKKDQSIAA